MSEDWYEPSQEFLLFKRSHTERLKESEPSEFGKGMASIALLQAFMNHVNGFLSPVVWEPFACSAHSRLADQCGASVTYIGHALEPSDWRIRDADSLCAGPGRMVDAIFYNPPYYGAAPFTDDSREVTAKDDGLAAYVRAVELSVRLCVGALSHGGIAFIVGRRYRFKGEEINLDWIFTHLFCKFGLNMERCYASIPDVAVMLRRSYE